MLWLLALVAAILACFSFVLLVGAPYLPTLSKQLATSLELADLQPGQVLLELGCGDGRVLIAAARQGVRCVGYELNPLLFLLCKVRTWRYRHLVSVRLSDFWRADWPKADAVFGFILPRLMHKLDAKILSEKRGPLKVVSFAFAIPDKEPVVQRDGVFLYQYK